MRQTLKFRQDNQSNFPLWNQRLHKIVQNNILISPISNVGIFKIGKLSWILSLECSRQPNLSVYNHLPYAQMKKSPAIWKTLIGSTDIITLR